MQANHTHFVSTDALGMTKKEECNAATKVGKWNFFWRKIQWLSKSWTKDETRLLVAESPATSSSQYIKPNLGKYERHQCSEKNQTSLIWVARHQSEGKGDKRQVCKLNCFSSASGSLMECFVLLSKGIQQQHFSMQQGPVNTKAIL